MRTALCLCVLVCGGRGAGCPEEVQGGGQGLRLWCSGGHQVGVCGGNAGTHSRCLAETYGLCMGPAEGSWGSSTCQGHSGSPAFARGQRGAQALRPPPPRQSHGALGHGLVSGGVWSGKPHRRWLQGSPGGHRAVGSPLGSEPSHLGRPRPVLRVHCRWVPAPPQTHRHTWACRLTHMLTGTDTPVDACTYRYMCTSMHRHANMNAYANTRPRIGAQTRFKPRL